MPGAWSRPETRAGARRAVYREAVGIEHLLVVQEQAADVLRFFDTARKVGSRKL